MKALKEDGAERLHWNIVVGIGAGGVFPPVHEEASVTCTNRRTGRIVKPELPAAGEDSPFLAERNQLTGVPSARYSEQTPSRCRGGVSILSRSRSIRKQLLNRCTPFVLCVLGFGRWVRVRVLPCTCSPVGAVVYILLPTR